MRARRIQVGDLSLTPLGPSSHSCPAWSSRIPGGTTIFAYSGDSAYGDAVIRAAQGADLLLCESIGPEYRELPNPAHMSATAAGRVAQQTGARALLLSHFTRHDPGRKEALVATAAAEFAGSIGVTKVGRKLTLDQLGNWS